MAYAEGTDVPVEKTIGEIQMVLKRYGQMSHFGFTQEPDCGTVMFQVEGRYIRMRIPIPSDSTMQKTQSGKKRTMQQRASAVDKETRRRWRALLLIVKAKLEYIAAGASSVEREFMADIIMPDGKTLSEHILPQVQLAYEKGSIPLLPWSGERG